MIRICSSCAAAIGVALLVQLQGQPVNQQERPSSTSTASAPDTVVGVYEGRTPCSEVSNQFTGFPAETCEKIKWELTLFKSAVNGEPSHYWYRGTRSEHRGRWSVIAHETQLNRTVYRLTSGADRHLDLLAIDGTVLLILGADGKALGGDASWSYTLSRTDR